jgi:hypothetical protein
MWIENTILSILNFIKNFFLTFYYGLFDQKRLKKIITAKNYDGITHPSVYFFLSLFIVSNFLFDNALYEKGNPFFVSTSEKLISHTQGFTTNLNGEIFFYIIPVYALIYLFSSFIFRIFNCPKYLREQAIQMVYFSVGTILILGTIFVTIIWDGLVVNFYGYIISHHFYDWTKSYNFLSWLYIIFLVTLTGFVIIKFTLCLSKDYLSRIAFIVIAISCISWTGGLYDIINGFFLKTQPESVSLKGPFDYSSLVKINALLDSATNRERVSFSLFLDNKTDSSFILSKNSKLLLNNYSQADYLKWIRREPIFEYGVPPYDFKTNKSPFSFEIKSFTRPDSIIVIKPFETIGLKFEMTMSLDSFQLFTKGDTASIKHSEIDLFMQGQGYLPELQEWDSRILYQRIIFEF